MSRKQRNKRRKAVIRVQGPDLRVSEDFIEGMRKFGVDPATVEAAKRRNERVERVKHERSAAAR